MPPPEARRTRYPGAQSFTDDGLSRRLFFGREAEATALRHRVLANRLTVLFARSGLGKTSLLNAGLAQSLREQGFLPLVVRVGDGRHDVAEAIVRNIEALCARQAGLEYVPGESGSLWRYFKTAEFWIDDLLMTPVLVLDQFEELFTLVGQARREAFLDDFSQVVRGIGPTDDCTAPAIKVVLSLREDFLGLLDELSSRLPGVLDQRFRLLPLSHAAAAEAIESPLQIEDASLASQPFLIEADVRDAVLRFLEQSARPEAGRTNAVAIEPFQLQLVCQHVEDLARRAQARGADAPVRITTRDLGGESRLRSIFREFYKRQVAAVPGLLQRRGVRRLCSEHLINARGRRLRLEQSEIRRLTGVSEATLETLVDRRLLRREQTPDADYYELSHDSLVLPIIDSRRLWLTVKSVWLLAVTLFVLVFLVAGGFGMWNVIEEVLTRLWDGRLRSEHLALALAALVLLAALARWAWRSVGELRDTFGRAVLRAAGSLRRSPAPPASAPGPSAPP